VAEDFGGDFFSIEIFEWNQTRQSDFHFFFFFFFKKKILFGWKWNFTFFIILFSVFKLRLSNEPVQN
jgi:hypothetical protein